MKPVLEYYRKLKGFSPNAKLYLLSTFANGIALGIFSLIFNLYLLNLGFKQDFIGLLVAAGTLVGAAGAIPAGLLGDRFAHKHILVSGGLLNTISLVGLATFRSRIALLTLRALLGTAGCLSWVICAPFMCAITSSHERTYLFSIQFAVMMLSSFLGNLLGGSLPGLLSPLVDSPAESPAAYRAAMLVSAGIAFVALIPLIMLKRTSQPSQSNPERPGIFCQMRTVLQNRKLVGKLLLPSFIASLGAGLLIPFINVFYKLKFATSIAVLGLLFAGWDVLMGLASLGGPILAGRIGKIRTVVSTQILSLPFLLLMGYSPLIVLSIAGFLIRGALMNMATPIYSVFVMERIGEGQRATVSGVSALFSQLAWSLSALISGYIQVGPGFNPIFILVFIIYLSSAILTYLFFSSVESATPAQDR